MRRILDMVTSPIRRAARWGTTHGRLGASALGLLACLWLIPTLFAVVAPAFLVFPLTETIPGTLDDTILAIGTVVLWVLLSALLGFMTLGLLLGWLEGPPPAQRRRGEPRSSALNARADATDVGSNEEAEVGRMVAQIESREAALRGAAYVGDGERWPDDPQEDARLVDAFVAVRDRNRGRDFAPADVLPADPGRIATALDRETARLDPAIIGDQRHLERYQLLVEAYVDLQAFRAPDDRDAIGPARAVAIQSIRGDPNSIGNANALRNERIAIGDARRALDLVARYRDQQASGFLTIVAWPISAAIGWIIAAIAFGPSFVVAVIMAVGWLASSYVGVVAGRIANMIDRSARRIGRAWLLRIAHPVAVGVMLGITCVGPAIIAILLTGIADRIGIP